MSKICTYKNDGKRCFCQIKFDSKERVLISIASTHSPSIRISKLLFGMIPVRTVWEYNPAMAGGYDAYVRNAMKMFSDFETTKHPLDSIVELLLTCSSIDSAARALLKAERKIEPLTSSDDIEDIDSTIEVLRHSIKIIEDYGVVLGESTNIANRAPISRLPYSKDIIKNAIKYLLVAIKHDSSRQLIKKAFPDSYEYVTSDKFIKSLKTGFFLLAEFISDEDAAICHEAFGSLPHTIDHNSLSDIIKRPFDRASEIQHKISIETHELSDELNQLLK